MQPHSLMLSSYHTCIWQGYAGGDEARMLQRHLLKRPAKIGVGANRAATAASFFEKYGYIDPCSCKSSERTCTDQKVGSHLKSEKIGAVILDDGMQVIILSIILYHCHDAVFMIYVSMRY